jgi:hypothetical protein
MVGDKRKFNVVLVTLKAVGSTGERPGERFAAPHVGSEWQPQPLPLRHPALHVPPPLLRLVAGSGFRFNLLRLVAGFSA